MADLIVTTTSGKRDLDEIQAASSLGTRWNKFLEQLDKFIQLKVDKDALGTEPKGTLFGGGDLALLQSYSTESKENYGINIEKLTQEANFKAESEYTKNLFQALIKRNYAHRMMIALSEIEKKDEPKKYFTDLIKLDGFEKALQDSRAKDSINLDAITRHDIYIKALEDSVRDSKDAAAALILAHHMLQAHTGEWTQGDREKLAKLQELIEQSSLLISYDPAFNPGRARLIKPTDDRTRQQVPQTTAAPMLVAAMGKGVDIFSRIRLITGKSFVKENISGGISNLYSNIITPLIGSVLKANKRLFLNHRNPDLTSRSLDALAEYAILTKSFDVNDLRRGEVEYIAEILQRNNASSYEHTIENLGYSSVETNPVEELRGELLVAGVGFTRRMNLGNDIFVQKIKTEPNERALLITSPSGYLELDGKFTSGLTEAMGLAQHLDDYVEAIKLLADFKEGTQDTANRARNQEIAKEVISRIGYARCPRFINSTLFDNRNVISELQRKFIENNPEDKNEIKLLCKRLADNNITNAREIQSYLYHLQELNRSQTKPVWIDEDFKAEAGNQRDMEAKLFLKHLVGLISAIDHHYPKVEKNLLEKDQYQSIAKRELYYLLDSLKKERKKTDLVDVNSFVNRLVYVVLSHVKDMKPELDMDALRIETPNVIRTLIQSDTFIAQDIDKQVSEFTEMINTLAA